MDTRLALVPDTEDPERGVVKPVAIKDGSVYYGTSVGRFTTNTPNGNTHVILNGDIDTIIHEVATRKGVAAELRAAEKDAKGTEIKPIITYNPKTKRFKEIYPSKGEESG